MKHILLVIMILGTASSGLAGLSSFDPFSGATDNAVYFNSAGSSAFVVVPADTREFQSQITTKQRDLKEQIAELTTARELLRAALEKTGTHIRFDTDDPVFRGKENSVTITAAYAMPKDVLRKNEREFLISLDYNIRLESKSAAK